nr:hypothetical protein HAGR004_40510 [Bdellovibrio sp. HAGR004]
MNAHSKISVLILFVLSLFGCASSTKGKVLRNTLLAGAAGAAYGSTRSDYKATHAAMYGASTAALAALVSIYAYDPDKSNEELRKETAELKYKLDQLEKPSLIDRGNSLFKSQIPSSLAKLVQPGEWKHYKLDQWIQDPSNPNVWLRQVEMYEIIPPSHGNQ